MRAAILEAPRSVRLGAVARLPPPGPTDALVRLLGSGVCASSLPVWEGRPWFTYPLAPGAPGHEAWGVVESVGAGVRRAQPGHRVAVLDEHAHAEYAVVPSDRLVVVPDTIAGPFPGESLGCAVNVFRRADIRRGHVVAVIGVGFLGAILTRLASRAGARVLAVSRRPYARDVARRFGAAEVIPFESRERAAAAILDATDGRGCPRVIEAVGTQESLDLATDATQDGGTLVIAGTHLDGTRRVDLSVWSARGLEVINAHEKDARVLTESMRVAAGLVASGVLDPSPLYTLFPLDRLGEAMDRMRARPDGFVKAVVTSC
jgi:threonine dehydrogenase-like Zn-dependent dehydrogenase